jgi:hypothetical protein
MQPTVRQVVSCLSNILSTGHIFNHIYVCPLLLANNSNSCYNYYYYYYYKRKVISRQTTIAKSFVMIISYPSWNKVTIMLRCWFTQFPQTCSIFTQQSVSLNKFCLSYGTHMTQASSWYQLKRTTKNFSFQNLQERQTSLKSKYRRLTRFIKRAQALYCDKPAK